MNSDVGVKLLALERQNQLAIRTQRTKALRAVLCAQVASHTLFKVSIRASTRVRFVRYQRKANTVEMQEAWRLPGDRLSLILNTSGKVVG